MAPSFRVVNSQPEMAEQLARIQRASFPTLDPGSLITAAHYRAHIARFPEGQFAVLNPTGELFDPTVSVQLKMGFTIHGISDNYVDDPSCENKAVLIV